MSADAESNGIMNGHAAGTAVLERVKQAREEAVRDGKNPPGRDALVNHLGISPWQAQQALKALKKVEELALSEPPQEPTELPAPTVAGTDQPNAAVAPEGPAEGPTLNCPPAPSVSTTSSPPRPWPLMLIGIAAAVALWSGWVGLGEKSGFGIIQPLPGIADGFTLNTAITLPISAEAYAAYALRVWLSTSFHSARTIAFARWSSILSFGIGVAAQAGYHLLEAFGYERAPWPVVLLVSSVPVAMALAASGLAKLVKDDRQAGGRQ